MKKHIKRVAIIVTSVLLVSTCSGLMGYELGKKEQFDSICQAYNSYIGHLKSIYKPFGPQESQEFNAVNKEI